jgi:histidine ammonia-lyase
VPLDQSADQGYFCSLPIFANMPESLISPDQPLTLNRISGILQDASDLALSDEGMRRIRKCRDYLDTAMSADAMPVYGINTGFGALCNTVIAGDALEKLQRNLLLSHASGAGAEMPASIVRVMILLKAHALSYGYSGVTVETVKMLIELYNRNIDPIVYEQGSLAPLAHLVLPLIGEGEVRYRGDRMSGAEALAGNDLTPLRLKSKEGLALINGTQFMSACMASVLMDANRLADLADRIAALSVEVFDARSDPFHPLIHSVRPHSGQVQVAERILSTLSGSKIRSVPKSQVQDPYCFRCIPQVHGASRDVFEYGRGVLETEINSVTDNPIIFADHATILSGGNFHGQPLALALDFIALALAELGSISERRSYKLLSGQNGLPAFLAADPGLHSGFMITHYTAAGIVSQNKQLCSPASIDTIDSSNGQEDHVSMGANAATKCLRIVENVKTLLAIELLIACQGLDFRRPLTSSESLEQLHAEIREVVPFIREDVFQHDLMKRVRDHLFGPASKV